MDHLEYHGGDVIYVTFNYDLASEPVSHPGERLPTSPVARPTVIVTPTPAVHPSLLTDAFLELEPVCERRGEDLVNSHDWSVAGP
jgi:hypothetical protein